MRDSTSMNSGLNVTDSTEASSQAGTRTARLKQISIMVAALLLSVGMVWLSYSYRSQLQRMGHMGGLGLFIISIIGNATVFIPAPAFAFACAAGNIMHPLNVGLIAGLGAAIGELTGYFAGMGGNALIPKTKFYERLHTFVEQRGMLTIFMLAAIPNPIFDMGGMIAGALRMPALKFLSAAWAGKAIRLGLTAAACTHGIDWIKPFLPG